MYLLYAQMAWRIGRERLRELTDRYLFHLSLQNIHSAIAQAQDQVLDVLEGVEHYGSTNLESVFFEEVGKRLRGARKVMVRCLKIAGELRTPELANIRAVLTSID